MESLGKFPSGASCICVHTDTDDRVVRASLASGTKLSVYSLTDSVVSLLFALDFENVIAHMCGTPNGFLLLVDTCNVLHFVTLDGVLICSYPLKCIDKLVHFQSLVVGERCSFIFVFSTGECREISNFPCASVSIHDAKGFSTLLAQLAFDKHHLSVHVSSADVFAEDGKCFYVVRDDAGALVKRSTDASLPALPLGKGIYTDALVLPDLDILLAITHAGCLELVTLSSGQVLCSEYVFSLASHLVIFHQTRQTRADWQAVVGTRSASSLVCFSIVGSMNHVPYIVPTGSVAGDWESVASVGVSSGAVSAACFCKVNGQDSMLCAAPPHVLAFAASLLAESVPTLPRSLLINAIAVEDVVAGMEALAGTHECTASLTLSLSAPLSVRETLLPLLIEWFISSRECDSAVYGYLSAISSAVEIGGDLRSTAAAIASDPTSVWESLLSDGSLEKSNVILRNHLSSICPTPTVIALSRISDTVDACELACWIEHVLIPSAQSVSEEELYELCSAIVVRARVYEGDRGLPIEAMHLIHSTLRILVTSGCRSPLLTDLRDETEKLERVFKLVSALQLRVGIHVCASEYSMQGANGLVFSILDDASAADLARIVSLLRSIQVDGNRESASSQRNEDSFGCADLDSLVLEWIESNLASTVFADCSDDTFLKLVNAAAAIVDSQTRTKAVLLLMQLPISANEESASTKALLSLAESVCTEGRSPESITEALRLFRLRSIAAKYGVDKFDIRNHQQVRAVVSTILNQTHMAQSIADAVRFSESWSSTSMNLSFILGGALFSRATDVSVELIPRFANIKAVIACIHDTSQLTCIIEDTLNALASAIEELFDADAKTVGCLLHESYELDYCTTIESAIFIASTFIDIVGEATKTSTAASLQETLKSTFVNIDYLGRLKALLALQTDYKLFLSLESYSNREICKVVASLLAKSSSQELLGHFDGGTIELASLLTPRIRRACSLLRVSTTLFLHVVLKEILGSGAPESLDVALSVLQLTSAETASYGSLSEEDSLLVVDAARRICMVSAKKSEGAFSDSQVIFRPFKVSQMSLRSYLEVSSGSTLGKCIDLFSAVDLVISVSSRLDDVARADTVNPSKLFKVCDSHYSKDGILMNASEVLRPIFNFTLKELERRSGKTRNSNEDAEDVRALSEVLQQSENHMLDARVLSSSWNVSPSKASMLRSSWLPLSRKILSYRVVDTLLAVSSLSCLPYDVVVRELKSLVRVLPTSTADATTASGTSYSQAAMSDFARLRSVAIVGEELSRLWNREDMLLVFEELQSNCRWLHQLQCLDVKVDLKQFQSNDSALKDSYIRSLAPELLLRSGMNLDMITEYCRQYNIESDFAALCYVEHCLISAPSEKLDSLWKTNVKYVSGGADDMAILKLLRRLLIKINSVDYDKIGFVCAWLIDILTEDTVHSQAVSPSSTNSSNDAEIETYARYNDVLNVLQSIAIPTLTEIRSDYSHVYTGLSGALLTRLPLWQLLEDPFGVMEKAIDCLPELSAKLFPICSILHLDRDDFLIRKFKTSYRTRRQSITGKLLQNASSFDGIFSIVQEELKLVSTIISKIEAIRWISEFERDECPLWAVHLLEQAVKQIDDGEVDEELAEIRTDLLADLVKFCCEDALKRLSSVEATDFSSVVLAREYASRSDPSYLISQILESCPRNAWNFQLRDFEQNFSLVTVDSIRKLPMSYRVVNYVATISGAVNEIYASSSRWVSGEKTNFLETIRKQLILDLVAMKSTGATVSDAPISDWGAFSEESDLNPSNAELRRREDCFAAFSIAVFVESCGKSAARTAYTLKLSEAATDKSSRLGQRSKYRAAQALCFLGLETTGGTSRQWCDFHYCAAEIKELRLTCSPDMLFSAISASGDIRPLVSTLLHDEGYHDGVSELCVDIMLACGVVDEGLWAKLMSHMLRNNQRKAAWQTLCTLSSQQIVRSILQSSARLDILKLMSSVFAEATEKLEQLITLKNDEKSRAEHVGNTGHVKSVSLVIAFNTAIEPTRDSHLSLENHALAFTRVASLMRVVDSCVYLKPATSMEKVELKSILDCWKRAATLSLSHLICTDPDTLGPAAFVGSYAKACVLSMLSPSLALASSQRLYSTAVVNAFLKDVYALMKMLYVKATDKVDVRLFEVLEAVCLSFDDSLVQQAFSMSFTLPRDNDILLWLLLSTLKFTNLRPSGRNVARLVLKFCSQSDSSNLYEKLSSSEVSALRLIQGRCCI